MSGLVSRYLGIVGTLTLATVVGCTDGFEPSSCRESRSCTPDDALPGEGGGGADGAPGAPPQGGVDGEDDNGVAGSPPDLAMTPECSRHEACSDGDPSDGQELCRRGRCSSGEAPPHVVRVTPNDEADDGDPDGNIVIEFSEPLNGKSVTEETIRVLDGDDEVAGELKYAGTKAVFTPDVPLRFRKVYRVAVLETVEDEAGQGMLSPFESTFTTRDGAWKTIDAVVGGVRAISTQLPISARGDVLLAWRGEVRGRAAARPRQNVSDSASSSRRPARSAGATRSAAA